MKIERTTEGVRHTMNIAHLGEFGLVDTQKTVIYLTWQAREYLSNAERNEADSLDLRAYWCREAASLLDAAEKLLEHDGPADVVLRGGGLLERAHLAAKAAVENGQIAARYDESLGGVPTDWERQRTPKAISIFKRAAETARQETHRALCELCEMFPEAMPTEER